MGPACVGPAVLRYGPDSMAPSEAPAGATERLFPYERWRAQLPELRRQFDEATPFPYLHLEHFLDDDVVRRVVDDFPGPTDTAWIQYKHVNENKLGKSDRDGFPETIGRVVDELNSPEFCAFLTELTGIEGLLADPGFEGGGLHQTESGGFLNVHADFLMHHHHPGWRRRINLILFLNEPWDPAWGGALELWDEDMSACVAEVPPLLDHAVVFATSEQSFHGYPDPITCPPGVTRKSLAFYYYTPDGERKVRSTDYRSRPADSRSRAALIWLDKKVLHAYSVVKSRLGLSDDFATRVLGALDRRKKGER